MENVVKREGRMIAVAAPAGSIITGDGLVIGALLGAASKAAAKGGTVMRDRPCKASSRQ